MSISGRGRVLAVRRLERNVADLDRAAGFYRSALGFVPAGTPHVLRLGTQEIALIEQPAGARYPGGSTAADLWFQHIAIVTADMPAAYRRVRRLGATPITRSGPQRLPPSSGGVTAYKFRDPDGHPLELLRLVCAKNPATGIDHSAISVADPTRSIAFYTGLLGMTLGKRQTNLGIEQENLDDLAGVLVEVIALDPAEVATPHIELLAYSRPRGRAAVPALGLADIAADRLVLQVENLDGLLAAVAGADSSRIVHAAQKKAVLRDPDGHLLVLTEDI